jgi:hypothetical protein
MKLAAPGQVFRQLKNQVVDFGRVRHGMFRRKRHGWLPQPGMKTV